MQSLPPEILQEIFKYLSANDLLELTAVCKNHRDLVAGSNLVKRLELKFRKLHSDKATLGSRHYTKLRIGFIRPKLHYELLDRIGKDLTSVTFRNSKLKIDAIRAALVLCPNISELAFDNSWLSDVPKLIKGPFPVLSGVKLSLNSSDPRVFRILRDCAVVELKMCQDHSECTFFNDFEDAKQFLLRQSCLVTLSLQGFYRTNFFEDNFLKDVKFKLKSFTLKQASFLRTDHLKTFLSSQIPSLEELRVADIDNCDLSEVINHSTCLQSLGISRMPLNYLEPLKSVTDLEITCHKALNVKVFRNFPSLKHLRMSSVSKIWLSEAVSENFQQLESLDIDGGSASDIRLHNLKTLTLKNVSEAPLDELLINLEEILVERCCFVDRKFVEAVTSFNNRLKTLTIVDCGTIKYDKMYLNVKQSL